MLHESQASLKKTRFLLNLMKPGPTTLSLQCIVILPFCFYELLRIFSRLNVFGQLTVWGLPKWYFCACHWGNGFLFCLFSRGYSSYGRALLLYLKVSRSSPMSWISTATVPHRKYLFQTGLKISEIGRNIDCFWEFIWSELKRFLWLFSFNSILLLCFTDVW